jgi:hypothetical protein
MGRKKRQQLEELRMSQAVEGLEEIMVETKAFNKNNAANAYSIIEDGNRYAVVCIEFDKINKVAGDIRIIETNTDKFLMQNRLEILMRGDDIL